MFPQFTFHHRFSQTLMHISDLHWSVNYLFLYPFIPSFLGLSLRTQIQLFQQFNVFWNGRAFHSHISSPQQNQASQKEDGLIGMLLWNMFAKIMPILMGMRYIKKNLTPILHLSRCSILPMMIIPTIFDYSTNILKGSKALEFGQLVGHPFPKSLLNNFTF
jgi:hypothetical protein